MYINVTKLAKRLFACSRSSQAALASVTGRNDVSFAPYITTINPPAPRKARGKTPLRFGFFGRLVSSKGLDVIGRLSRDEELADIEWEIHGAGGNIDLLMNGRNANVTLKGAYNSSADYCDRLSQLDAVVLFSSHNEGMPLSLIEATGAGIPWIATNQGGTMELARVWQNCEVIPAKASYNDAKEAVLRLARRIVSGEVSREEQLSVYEEHFAVSPVGRLWMSALGVSTVA